MINRYLSSDLHFGHENIVPSRPQFKNVDEMDECLIRNWNRKVNDQDEVYILGDLSFRTRKGIHQYPSRLKGKKHLYQCY